MQRKLLVLACVALAAAAGLVRAVDLEVDENLEDLTRAKVAKHRAKQNAQFQGKDDAEKDGGGGCGSVDIGNSVGGRPGSPGPKEIVVVVKGDIINANNKCKD